MHIAVSRGGSGGHHYSKAAFGAGAVNGRDAPETVLSELIVNDFSSSCVADKYSAWISPVTQVIPAVASLVAPLASANALVPVRG